MAYFADPVAMFQGYLPTAVAILYTAPDPVDQGVQPKAIIKEILINNTTATDGLTYRLYKVPYLGTVEGQRIIAADIPIEGNTLHRILVSTVLEAGETIRGYASAANSITANISGIELI